MLVSSQIGVVKIDIGVATNMMCFCRLTKLDSARD